METLTASLDDLIVVPGVQAVALVDLAYGTLLDQILGEGFTPQAAEEHAGFIRTRLRAMVELGLSASLEDIVITLGGYYHIGRLVVPSGMTQFLYVAVDRAESNLALARLKIAEVANSIDLDI